MFSTRICNLIPLLSLFTFPTSATTPCDAVAIPKPSLFGAYILSISAAQTNNSTLSSPPVTFCNISITYTHPGQNDLLNVWIFLPSAWNGRFQGVGGGGWRTGLDLTAMIPAVAQGYAAASTDGGHLSTASTESWALLSPGNINWALLQDFAAIALNDLTVLGKQVTESYYSKKIKKSYWNGCSTGGRQGLMMAQRYPGSYDGILAAAPAINWAEFIPTEFWPQRKMYEAGYFPSQCEFDAVTAAAVEACDELDGLKDGVVGMVNGCGFRAEQAIGKAYSCETTVGTVSAKTTAIVQSIWDGARDSEGKFQWYGLTHQAPMSGLANTTCASNGTCTGVPFAITSEWHRIFLERNNSFDPYSLSAYSWDRAFKLSKNAYTSIMGTSDPDLSLFKKSGAKMITWHGTADQLIFFNGTIDYYRRVLNLDANARDFYRFYSAPGVEHCRGGKGPFPSDALATLVKWVEAGEAPERLPASRMINGQKWEQELCQYPLTSIYTGGDPKNATSFVCK